MFNNKTKYKYIIIKYLKLKLIIYNLKNFLNPKINLLINSI